MDRKMQAIDMRRLLILLLLTAHVHGSLREIDNNIRELILSRAIVRVASDVGVNKIQLKTVHFIQNEAKQDDIIVGAVDHFRTSLTYTIEDIGHISEWYPRWFNIILINGEEDFRNFAENLKDIYFDPFGFYVIVTKTVLNANERENLSRYIFKLFFSLFYDNVIALFRDEDGTTVFMYAFLPCDGTHACYEVVPVLHNTFDGEQFGKKILHFPNKWKNFNSCPISVALSKKLPYVAFIETIQGEMQITGIDVNILQMIASHLNFTMDYKISKERGWLYPNGTSTGAFKNLLNGKASLTVGGYNPSINSLRMFSASIPYMQSELVFVLPVSQVLGSLQRHLVPLKKEIWIVYFSIHCCAFVFLSILKRFGSKLYYFVVGDHSRSPFLDMFQMFFGVSLHRTPKYTFARTLFGIWLLSTLIISSTYRGRLVEILTSKSPKSIPNTISEFDEMKYEIHIRPELEHYTTILYGNDSRIKQIPQKMWDYFLELQVPSDRRRAVMEFRMYINFFNARNYKEGILPILPERLLSNSVCMFFEKNSYFVAPFNQVLRDFTDSGLIDKWTQEYIQARSAKSLLATSEHKALNLSHFEGTFELYFMVVGISILMFVMELLSLKINMIREIMQFYTE